MNNKSSRKIKVLLLSVGNFLMAVSSLLLTIFLTRIFSVNQYVDYKQTLLIYNLFTPILIFGIDKSIFYFFSMDNTNKNNDYKNLLLFLFFSNLLYVLFFIVSGAELFSNQFHNPTIKGFLIIYSIISLFEIPTRLLTPILVIQEKVKLLTLFNILYRVTFFAVSVGLAFVYKKVEIVLISQVVLAFIAFLFSQYFASIVLKNKTNFSIDLSVIKKYLIIGIPLSIATILGFFGKNIDKALIAHYLSKEDFAYYVNGAIEIPLIASITGSVMTILLADFSVLYKKNNFTEIFKLWTKAVKYNSSFLILLMFFLLINAKFLLTSMFGIQYIESVKPFMIYLLLLPLRTMFFSSLITVTGKTKLILYGAILYLVVNVVLSLVLISFFGFVGPAIATVVSTYLLAIYNSFVIKNHYKVAFFKVLNFHDQRYFFLAGFVPFFFLTFVDIPNMSKLLVMFFKNLIFLISYSSLIVFFKQQSIYIEIFRMLKKNK